MDLGYELEGDFHAISLGDGEVLLGRGPEADLLIPAPEISARHAILRIDKDRLFVRDLDSTNGSRVDGVYITAGQGEVEVPPGSMMIFADIPVMRVEDRSVKRTLQDTREPVTRGVYNLDEGYSETAGAKLADMLSSLFELMAAEESAETIVVNTCEFISKWITADRVIMLQDRGEGTAVKPVAFWPRTETGADDIVLSRTIIDRVMNERTSVLLVDALGGEGNPSQSMVALSLCSVMAVPLFDNTRVRGIIYVESRRPGISYTNDELQVVTATANAVAVRLRNLTMERELFTAARIQRAILPTDLPEIPGFDIRARMDMCREVGGDLYHVVPLENGHFMLALGDVAGKGVPAALAMSACMLLISTLSEILDDVTCIACMIHRKLYESLAHDQFITLFLADLDPETGILTYTNAGHEPPLLIGAEGALRELPSCAPPVVLVDEFDCPKNIVQMQPGEILAVFSDGIPEATRDTDVFMGLDGVKSILKGMRTDTLDRIAEAIVKEVDDFLDGHHASDDVTLMLLKRRPPED